MQAQSELDLWFTFYTDAALVFMKTDGYEKEQTARQLLQFLITLLCLICNEGPHFRGTVFWEICRKGAT